MIYIIIIIIIIFIMIIIWLYIIHATPTGTDAENRVPEQTCI